MQLKANLGYTLAPVSKKKKKRVGGNERKNKSSCFLGAMRIQKVSSVKELIQTVRHSFIESA